MQANTKVLVYLHLGAIASKPNPVLVVVKAEVSFVFYTHREAKIYRLLR